MIGLVELNYNTKHTVKNLPRERYMLLREKLFQLQLPDWPEDKNEPPAWYKYGDSIVIDITTDLLVLDDFGMKYEIKKIKNTYVTKHELPNGSTVNLNFALPNIGLLSINEVTWRDDACTEEIQRLLEEGWRIVAVCPPNGARRPDYILGRTKPD